MRGVKSHRQVFKRSLVAVQQTDVLTNLDLFLIRLFQNVEIVSNVTKPCNSYGKKHLFSQQSTNRKVTRSEDRLEQQRGNL